MAESIILVTRENAAAVSSKLPMLARATIKALVNIEYGTLEIKWPNGLITLIKGEKAGTGARINLKSLDLPKRVFQNGDVGVGESYMDEQWHSPDITAVLLLFCENSHLMIARQRSFMAGLISKFVSWRDQNTKNGSKRNIASHYDLGNEFYRRWLDPSMTYSSAIYEHGINSLEEAQRTKYASLVKQTNIRKSDHVLEIGCGWGGFAEFAAREIGCHVTGITISGEQFDYAQKRIFEAGLNEKVDIVFRDYREEKGLYDRIVSIEMFEAVGEKYWPTYFDTLKDCLKPGGRAGIQTITIQNHFFESYKGSTDFIQQYIFPGGMLPTAEILADLGEERGLFLSAERIFAQDYAKTLIQWRENFRKAWPEIIPLGFDERFKRMWEFYLHYCEAGFRSENIDVRQMTFSKPA